MKCFKPFLVTVVAVLVVGLPLPGFAIDLQQVYRQAIDHDPTFKEAQATWLAAREGLPVSVAALLPSLDIGGTLARTRLKNNSTGNPNDLDSGFYNNSTTYNITLTQPIFNFAAWAAVADAAATVRQAEATFSAAAQDLMMRVATAYFAVLESGDVLRYTQVEKRAIGRQLEQTQQQYKVGLIAITAVHDAQASYDAVVATEIAAKNEVSNKQEQLREITGQLYSSLKGLTDRLPLVRPDPANIDQWVRVAMRQNYALLATKAGADAAKKNIGEQAAARYPTLNASGGYAYDYENNPAGTGFSKKKSVSGVLTLDFPIFQGGLVTASTRQARYQYQQAVAAWELQYRSVVSQTRQAYLGVLSGISQIQADRQAILSARSAVKSNEAGYLVGTRTIVDVLSAQSSLYNALQSYAKDQYQYIIETLTLKQEAGTLSLRDIAQVNGWLKGELKIDPYVPDVKSQKVIRRSVRMKKPAPKQQLVNVTQNTPLHMTAAEHHMLNVDPKHYTIQLVASHGKGRIQQFIAREHLQADTAFYKTALRGKPWYQVIYGDYADKKQAQQALKGLSLGVRAYQPWVRPFSSVQKELGKRSA